MEINIANLFILGSVFIGVTFGCLLIFAKRTNQSANRFLGYATLIIVTWNIWMLNIGFNIYFYFPILYLIPLTFSLALGPCIYFYTKKISDAAYLITKKKLLHFAPVLIEIILYYSMAIDAYNKETPFFETFSFSFLLPIIQFLALVSVVVYCVFSLKEIRKFHYWLNNNFSNASKYNLDWLYRLLTLFGILWVLWLPYSIVDFYFFNYELEMIYYYPLYILMSIITIWIAAEAFLKPEIVVLKNKSSRHKVEQPLTKEIADKSKWLVNKMERNLFYLNPELTLKTLADELKVHPTKLSEIIHVGFNKNFNDFINDYRVKAVKLHLKNPNYNNITLLGIAYDCGFNAKTTFNRVFKKHTGKTPLQYKRSI